MNTAQHTQTPYAIGSAPTTIVSTGANGQAIVVAVTATPDSSHSFGQMCADARFIVKAANSHEALVAALRKIAAADMGEGGCYYTNLENIRVAKAALAAAESA